MKQRRIIFSIVVFFISCFILEGTSRLITHAYLTQPLATSFSLQMGDPVLHHKWRPSLRKLEQSYGSFLIITNKQSWNEDYDVEVKKPNNTFRIFYVGDSTTQRVVPSEYKMVEIVERQLNKRFKESGITFEVINTGTSSYSFLLYYLLIKTRLLEYSPDLIVINVDMTDVINDAVYRRFIVKNEQGEIIAVPPSKTERYITTPRGYAKVDLNFNLPRWLVRHSDFFFLVDFGIRYAAIKNAPSIVAEDADWLRHKWSKEINDNVNESLKVLLLTLELLKSQRINVMVTGVPHYPQYIGMWSSLPHKVLGQAVRNAGVAYLDSFQELKDEIQGSALSQYYWSNDGTHFNKTGNAIWAQAQLDFLLDAKNGLLPFIDYSREELLREFATSSLMWKQITNT